MGIAFRYAARSDVGRVRAKNDDSGYAGHYLAVVADGMGGHVGGDVASATTVLDLTPLDHPGFHGSAGVYLADEITTANMIMNELVDLNPRLSGMGTTCTALLIDGGQIELAHIGDSRAYRLRGENFEQITTDHTFVQRLLEEGRLTPQEAENHPHKNVIMRVLGDVDASPELQTKTLDAEIGEKWVLSSDGLDSVVEVSEIEAVMRSTGDLKQICDTLVDLTLDRGAPDNVTVMVLSVIDEESLSDAITSPQPIIPLRKYTQDGELIGEAPEVEKDADLTPSAEDKPEDGEEAAETADGEEAASKHRAPWRRRLPHDAKLRNALRHGKWRGESFSDGVFNMMTETSGLDERPERCEDSSAAVLRQELNERPHQLVGAAANATNTGMIPAVTNRTLERRATMTETKEQQPVDDPADLPEEIQALIDDSQPPRPNWPLRFFVTVLALGAVLAAGAAFLNWVDNQYYVGISDEKVAVYSGIPQSIGPVHLYEVVEETDIEVNSLPEYSRSLLQGTISAEDKADAERIVSDLQAQADLRSGSGQDSPQPTPGTVTTVRPSDSASPSSSEPSRSGGTNG